MCGLADEPQDVTLDSKRANHDTGRFVHRLEHRPLLDVQFEIRASVDRPQRLLRTTHSIQFNTVLTKGLGQLDTLFVGQPPHLVEIQAAAGRR